MLQTNKLGHIRVYLSILLLGYIAFRCDLQAWVYSVKSCKLISWVLFVLLFLGVNWLSSWYNLLSTVFIPVFLIFNKQLNILFVVAKFAGDIIYINVFTMTRIICFLECNVNVAMVVPVTASKDLNRIFVLELQKDGPGAPGGQSWTVQWLKFDNSYFKVWNWSHFVFSSKKRCKGVWFSFTHTYRISKLKEMKICLCCQLMLFFLKIPLSR